MSYQITITHTRHVKTVAGKEWAVIGTREVSRESRFYEASPNEPKTRIEDVHGYTPEVEKLEVKSVEILKQTVDHLDLPAVIKAINHL